MNAKEILNDITIARDALASLIVFSQSLTRDIARKREGLKSVEDAIVNEIWSDENFKNDRARNEQKHLARINDARYTTVAEDITELERAKAQCHADILTTQNELQVSTIQYQAAMLATSVTGFQFQLVPVELSDADTTKLIDMEVKLEAAIPPAPVEAVNDLKGKNVNDVPYLKPESGKQPEKVGNVVI
jgi:hypothetical protein